MFYHKLAILVAAVGAINWATSAFKFNLVNMLVGTIPAVETGIYVIVGIAGVISLLALFKYWSAMAY